MQRRALGKGLDALIPKKAAAVATQELAHIPIDQIHPGNYQPRQTIEKKELEELSQSIKANGVIQPIVVRKTSKGDYEIVAGGRRYEAAKLLGINELPAVIKDTDDKQTFIFAIIENLQRKDLNPIEEAEAFQRLMAEFSFSLDNIAHFVGKDKTTVVNTMRLLKLSPQIQEALRQGVISRSQARTILGADEKMQRALFEDILKGGMSVREVERRVQKVSKKKRPVDPFITEVEERLQTALGTKVRICNSKKNKGKVVIEYFTLEDLDRIVGRIT